MHLARSFAKTNKALEVANAALEANNKATMPELQEVRNVQMSLMPHTAPEIEGLEIAGRCLAAREVSGDFFDYLQAVLSYEVAIVVGDVTGKAMKGAMNAVMTNGVLRLAAKPQPNLSPAALLGELNDVLKERLEELMNVTMVIGLVSVEAKRLTLANAAHHAHPLLVRKGEVQRLIAKGMLLGMMAGIRYREVEFLLQSGDVVVFMTDGIIEITDPSGQDYAGSGQLEQVIGGFTAEMPPREMVDVLIDDALAYGRRKAEQDDYMTGG